MNAIRGFLGAGLASAGFVMLLLWLQFGTDVAI